MSSCALKSSTRTSSRSKYRVRVIVCRFELKSILPLELYSLTLKSIVIESERRIGVLAWAWE